MKSQFEIMTEIIGLMLANPEGISVAQIKKELKLHRTQVDRTIKDFRDEGLLIIEKEGTENYLRLDFEKTKQYSGVVLKNFATTSADVLRYFYRDNLDQKKSIREIIEELKVSQILNAK